MPGQRRRYRFVIAESFTPDTLPMWRLAEYMADLADLLGEKAYVHFVQVEASSTALVQEVDHEVYPKVRTRVNDVKRGEGAADARRAYEALDRRLATDNASGMLVEDAPDPAMQVARVLDFPGRKRFVEPEYGPITEAGVLQGTVWMVGGDSEPVPVHIKDGETLHVCRAKRPIAMELAKHIYRQSVRVSGNGRWFRDARGAWTMKSFQILGYTLLEDDALSTVVARLRHIPGTWKRDPQAMQTLRELRVGNDI